MTKFKIGDHVVYRDGSTPFVISELENDYGKRGQIRYWGTRTDYAKDFEHGYAIGAYEDQIILLTDLEKRRFLND